MKDEHWIRKAIKYTETGTLLAFLSLLFSLTLGAIVIYGNLNGWWT